MKRKTIVCLSLIGLVASLASAALAQTFSVIHAFTGGADGGFPAAGLTLKGNVLYGTSEANVYEITRAGNDWVFMPIFFPVSNNISNVPAQVPESRVLFGPDGRLYGTTIGELDRGFTTGGTVFGLTPPTALCKSETCPPLWTSSLLHAFHGLNDGNTPEYGDLAWDHQGNIYGTTALGGPYGQGTVYELMPPVPPNDTWTESVLYSFTGHMDGGLPQGGVILDSNGNVYGTSYGDLVSGGNVFELTNNGGQWTQTLIHNFQDGDGAYPIAGLISDSSGNLYGATSAGGSSSAGTIFELIRSGNGWTFKVLYNLPGPFCGDNCGPWANLSMDAAGNLYGTTNGGGANSRGNVFKLSNTGNGWVYKSLYDFTYGPDGAYPLSNVTLDTDGTLYGTAQRGGNSAAFPCSEFDGCGVVWMIKP
jgi:uncharacterized repeat protein (TIGR03803 family)